MRPTTALLLAYLRRLAEVERRGDAREESYYGALQTLLQEYAAASGRKTVRVTVLPRRTEAGVVVDFQVWRGARIAGYVEAKRPGANLDAAEKSDQMKRYREAFPNVLLTDFYELRRYRQKESVERAVLESPLARFYADRLTDEVQGEAAVTGLLDRFLDFAAPRPGSAAALAVGLAHRARLLESAIEELLAEDGEKTSELAGLYRAFSEYLIHGLTPREFADLYAQTLVYGLLAACWYAPGDFALQTVLDHIPRGNGILRDLFRYIALAETPDPRPRLAWIVDDIVELLAASPVDRLLTRRHGGAARDPILHFYETFLAQYDRGLRKRRGVYYTPRQLAGYVVRSVDGLLRERLGRPDGLADGGVTLLDPAAGTLTFLAEAFRVAIDGYRDRHGAGSVAALLRDHLLQDFHAFELMMAPYAIGHLKMGLLLAAEGLPLPLEKRFPLFLTNTLELEELKQTNLPGMAALSRESQAAGRIKKEARIAVILGNPPYSGHSYNRSRHIVDLLRRFRDFPERDEGYYRVDGRALTERNLKWLQDDYVKFLRFAQWKIEQNGWGVVGFVTNHGYLDNPTFRGLRRSLLRTFDEIYLLDLHGNRKKGERAPDGGPDESVFPGIEQGVAVCLLVKLPGPRRPGAGTRVFRADLQGRAVDKLQWLDDHERATTRWTEISPRPPVYYFQQNSADPRADTARIEEEYGCGMALPEIFPRHSVGVVTARDAFVLDFSRPELEAKLLAFRVAQGQVFPEEWKLEDRGGFVVLQAQQKARDDERWRERFTEILYRPFDVRPIFYADYLVARPRRQLMNHMGQPGSNLGLVCPAQHKEETGALVTDRIAGHKAVSAYDINSLFPLYFKDPLLGRTPNVAPGLLARLGEAHGREPSPEELLAYVYAVLYSRAYRERYRALLRQGFPRIPLTRDGACFGALASLGAELIDLHLLRAPILATPGSRLEPAGSGTLGKQRDYRPEEERVYVNEEGQSFDGITPEVWAYRIGGYQVLDRWLASRAGRTLGQCEQEAFWKTVAALERTLEVERRIAEVWPTVEEGAVVAVGSVPTGQGRPTVM
ncbi:MAG TPA: type ISP restriction/modification enzyme [Thermoanaerobaculia bacterium]|nr:type ISP restriction/modification enzyme [Thermoanaerobaculia bacterium]